MLALKNLVQILLPEGRRENWSALGFGYLIPNSYQFSLLAFSLPGDKSTLIFAKMRSKNICNFLNSRHSSQFEELVVMLRLFYLKSVLLFSVGLPRTY